MKNKPLLLKEELSRIFELMNIGFNPNILLESGGGGGTTIAKSLMPGESKTIDNLVTTLAKSENDLLTYSAKLASMAPNGTFDEIAQKIAADSGKPVDDLTDQMVKDWIKTQPGLMDDLQAAAAKIAKEAVDKEIANFNIQSVFDNLATSTGNASLKDFPQQFAGIIGIKINDANKGTMGRYLDGMQKIVDEMPDSEAKIKMEEQIMGKRSAVDNLSGKSSPLSPGRGVDAEKLADDLDNWFNKNQTPPTTKEELDTKITEILDSMRDSGFPIPPHIKYDELMAQVKIELSNVPLPGKEGIAKWDALGPARQKQLVENAKSKFPAPNIPPTPTIYQKYTGLRGFLFNRFFNKKGLIDWWAVYKYGAMVSAIECLVVNGINFASEVEKASEGESSEMKDAAKQAGVCIAYSLGSWIGLVYNIVDQTGVNDVFKSYENTEESFEQFLKDNDIKYSGFGKEDSGYYYIPESGGEGPSYKFENNTFVKI